MRRRSEVPGADYMADGIVPNGLFKPETGRAAREPFRTVVADPGWPFGDKLPGAGRGAAKNYKTMAVDAIARYLEGFAMMNELGGEWPDGVIARDARLFLWRVHAMQEEALHVMRAWGFYGPVSELVWDKVDKDDEAVGKAMRKRMQAALRGNPDLTEDAKAEIMIEEARRLTFGMGRTFRASHEVCLVGRRGRPERLSGSERSVFFAQVREHSQKPEEFFEIVERVSPGPYLEIFAGGHRREGWTCLGDDHRAPAGVDEGAAAASG